MNTITVTPDADASGAFHCLQDAIDSIPDSNHTPVTIALAPGIYHEKIKLEKPFVTLLGMGASPEDTVISYDDYGYFRMPDGKKRGTFRSYTLFVHAEDITLRNLTVENASGDSKTHGQAIALYAECDRLTVDSCRLLGHQDTLFTGPLPPKEYEPDGFIGPTRYAPRINGRQYYRNCYICGDIDFIFGSATAYFESCTLESLRRTAPGESASPKALPRAAENDTHLHASTAGTASAIEGYVTAASTPEGQEYGYVFSDCCFISADCPAASVYLGRPWRDHARTVLLHCALGAHIHPAGFHDWDKEHAHGTVFYAECGSYPLEEPYASRTASSSAPDAAVLCIGADCRPYRHRADFVCELDAVQAEHFSKENVLAGDDGWLPG